MNDHSWTKWSAVAEIISSIAILITLIYLAVQTQQNTDAILSQSRQNTFTLGQTELPLWMAYPEMSAFIIDNSLEMTLEQKVQLDTLMILALQRREFAWGEYQNGRLDEESWQAELEVMSLLVGTPRLREWWNNVGRYGRPPGFAKEMDKLITEDDSMHPYWENLKNWDTSAKKPN